VYLTDEHQPDRTTSETPFFCYSHLVMKISFSGKGAPPAVPPKLSFGPDEGVLETNVALNSTYLQVIPAGFAHAHRAQLFLQPAKPGSAARRPRALSQCSPSAHPCLLVALSDETRHMTLPLSMARFPRVATCVPSQSLMERALAGSFDRSLKFGHSGGVWQVNDKGWEDDHDHIDFDVSRDYASILVHDLYTVRLVLHVHAQIRWPSWRAACSPNSCAWHEPQGQRLPRCRTWVRTTWSCGAWSRAAAGSTRCTST
jgi:hypothetical protein